MEEIHINGSSSAGSQDDCFLLIDGSQGQQFSYQTSDQCCSINSPSGTIGHHDYSSSSTVCFSPNQNPMLLTDPNALHHSSDIDCFSTTNSSYIMADADYVSNRLRELEITMLGPQFDILEAENATATLDVHDHISSNTEKQKQLMVMIARGDLKELLLACAKAFAENDQFTSEWLISEIRQMVSVCGEPVQRLGAYMLEGLVARLASTGSAISKSLRCKVITGADLLSYMQLLYHVCPYFKFGYLSANGAIADAMKDENRIHIIDFQISQGSQWFTLIHALAARPGGPPQIRITGIDDPLSTFARGGGIHIVGQALQKLAESCSIPFEFHAVPVSGSEIEAEHLKVQPGEALAVNFALSLHHIPDENTDTHNHRDRLLRLVKSLSPKVVTLVEQESNSNSLPFFPRFVETMNYYMAIFESLDVVLPREDKERINVEQHCLAGEVVNIIACEGAERVERHELLSKWKSRFLKAGFTPYPLSSYVNATIKTLLADYNKNYKIEKRDEALFLGWMNKDLISSCAWK